MHRAPPRGPVNFLHVQGSFSAAGLSSVKDQYNSIPVTVCGPIPILSSFSRWLSCYFFSSFYCTDTFRVFNQLRPIWDSYPVEVHNWAFPLQSVLHTSITGSPRMGVPISVINSMSPQRNLTCIRCVCFFNLSGRCYLFVCSRIEIGRSSHALTELSIASLDRR